jgi:hypothetical protein
MRPDELRRIVADELAAGFSGWDFGRVTRSGRMEEFPLDWNYRSELGPYLRASSAMLDLGTGGGEFLDSLEPLPPRTCATEGYAPNLPIAAARLAKRGVEVRPIEDNLIPFEDGAFDLAINRHESYKPEELRRVLEAGGAYVTQQVGGMNGADLNMTLGYPSMPFAECCLAKAVLELEACGFSIAKARECLTKTRFFDIGAIVYYLKCIPWQIDDFDAEACIDRLRALASRIEDLGYIDFVCHRYLIVARRD